MRNLRRFLLVCFALSLILAHLFNPTWANSASSVGSTITPIRYWNGTEARDRYEFALLLLALNKTSENSPAYHISRLDDDLGSDRARHELAKGDLINVYASPHRDKAGPIEQGIIQIPIPLLKGLLGYRSLVVRKQDLSVFSQVQSIRGLRGLRIGQGRGWPDVAIYKHNGFEVMDEGLFSNLFAMLELGRFDCLPLGVVEADATLAAFDGAKRGLVVEPNITLYYPWPVLFHVSGKHPELAARIERGLEMALADGSFDRLFDQHYGELVNFLRNKNDRILVLNNPTLPHTMGLKEPQLTALGL